MARRPRNVLSDPALALLWNHDHEMFSYLHKYCVLSQNCFLLTGVCLSLIPFITREPSNISPLTSHPHTFPRFSPFPLRIKISGVPFLAVHHPSFLSFFHLQSLPIATLLRAMLDSTLHIFFGAVHSFHSHL